MYRILFTGSAVLWLTAMSALVVRDVWPAWTAQDAPPVTSDVLARLDRRAEQYGIFNSQGVRLGTAWSQIEKSPSGMTIQGTATVAVLPFPELLIETTTEFTADGALDRFDLSVRGVPGTHIHAHGEPRGKYFPCELQVGPLHREANLELSASRMIADTLRPFSFLPTLRVGQSWRMQFLDPMSAVISRKTEFTSIVATVTREETIEHNGQSVRCKVVETSPQHAKAWVGPDGRVLVQEVDVPGLGKIRVRDEHYDLSALEAARQRIGGPGYHRMEN